MGMRWKHWLYLEKLRDSAETLGRATHDPKGLGGTRCQAAPIQQFLKTQKLSYTIQHCLLFSLPLLKCPEFYRISEISST